MPNNTKKLVSKTRQELLDMYINALKEEKLPWEMPWRSGINMKPKNFVSGKTYRGVNRMLLTIISDIRGLEDGRWATFNQIEDKKKIYHPGEEWHLRKGSKGVPIELWKIKDIKANKLIDFDEYYRIIHDDPDLKKNYQLFSHTYHVYSLADVDGAPQIEKEVSETVSIPELEEFCDEVLHNIGVSLTHGGSEAYYSPRDDRIVMPEISKFVTAEDYYATRLHETAHSTGAKKRLDRDLSGTFGSESYAKEELRAEIASSLLFADLHMPTTANTLDNHKAYIQSWIADLEKDPLILFQAIKDAEKISDYVLDHAPIAREKIYGNTITSNYDDAIAAGLEMVM